MKAAASKEDTFVPFGPATAGHPINSGPPQGLKVIPATDATEAFAPLYAGTASHAHGTTKSGNAVPSISVQKEGERITGIRIECLCGQVIELACEY